MRINDALEHLPTLLDSPLEWSIFENTTDDGWVNLQIRNTVIRVPVRTRRKRIESFTKPVRIFVIRYTDRNGGAVEYMAGQRNCAQAEIQLAEEVWRFTDYMEDRRTALRAMTIFPEKTQ